MVHWELWRHVRYDGQPGNHYRAGLRDDLLCPGGGYLQYNHVRSGDIHADDRFRGPDQRYGPLGLFGSNPDLDSSRRLTWRRSIVGLVFHQLRYRIGWRRQSVDY